MEGEDPDASPSLPHHQPSAPDELLRKAVYALTSAARGSRAVQMRLLEAGGMEALGKLLASPAASTALRVKVATFGVDLLAEVAQAGSDGVVPNLGSQLEAALASSAWCRGSLTLLNDVKFDPVELEKVLLAMKALMHGCEGSGEIGVAAVKSALDGIRGLYQGGPEAELTVHIQPAYRDDLLGLIERLEVVLVRGVQDPPPPEEGQEEERGREEL